MVDTCPNCGQPSRAGARFCTSCGFRLPERTVDADSAPLSRSPFATTSTIAASRWPSPSSSDAVDSVESTTPEPVAVETSIDDSQSELPEEIALPGPATSDQPAEAVELEAASDTVQTEPVVEVEPPSVPEPEPEPEPSFPIWPTFPSYGSTTSNDVPAWYAQDVPSASEALEESVPLEDDEPGDRALEETALDDVQGPDATDDDAVGDYVGSYAPATDGGDSPDDAVAVPAPSAYEADAVVATDNRQSSETLERAQELLAELTALLPTLGANATAQTSSSSVVAESLAAVQGDETEFDDLMEAVAAVRARPRDIDVVLSLSRHVEAIVTLKDRYNQAQAAISEALAHLETT